MLNSLSELYNEISKTDTDNTLGRTFKVTKYNGSSKQIYYIYNMNVNYHTMQYVISKELYGILLDWLMVEVNIRENGEYIFSKRDLLNIITGDRNVKWNKL